MNSGNLPEVSVVASLVGNIVATKNKTAVNGKEKQDANVVRSVTAINNFRSDFLLLDNIDL